VKTEWQRRAVGIALVEVLVALLLLAVALVTLGGWQLQAARFNQEAWQRTAALLLADEMLSRIGLNPDGLPHYAVADVAAQSGPVDCGASCTPDARARADLQDWWAAVTADPAVLPAAMACITVQGGYARVSLVWQGGAAAGVVAVPDGSPPCGRSADVGRVAHASIGRLL